MNILGMVFLVQLALSAEINDTGTSDAASSTIIEATSEAASSTDIIDGGWTVWAADPEMDCCQSAGRMRHIRECTNPAPLNGGNQCFGIREKFLPCSCECATDCDPTTAFCANETGLPAFCMCQYDIDFFDNVTDCVSEYSLNANDTFEQEETDEEEATTSQLSGGRKTVVAILQVILACWVIAWCLATVIICTIFRAFGWHRFIHMFEEATLMVVYALIGFAVMNLANSEIMCKIVAGLLHYVFLSTMMFFVVEGLFAYGMTTAIAAKDSVVRPVALNALIGFGLPIIPFAIAFIILNDEYGTSGIHCWCRMDSSQAWAILLPIFSLFFISGILAEASGIDDYHMRLDNVDRDQLYWSIAAHKSLMGVSFLTMLTYFMGLIAVDQQSLWTFIIFHLFNFILGPVIFIYHTNGHLKVAEPMNKMFPFLPFYSIVPIPTNEEYYDEPEMMEESQPFEETNQNDGNDANTDWRKFHAWVTDKDDTGDIATQSESVLFNK